MSEHTCELRGVNFRQPHEKEYAQAMGVGAQFELEREPDNAYDAYAIKVIKVLSGDTRLHLGYVAKEIASWIAPDMDEGISFTCVLTDFQQRGRTNYPILTINQVE